ncbi:MAG: SO2930 family diheme c-type cytochrome [Saprospiraceae bacterium]
MKNCVILAGLSLWMSLVTCTTNNTRSVKIGDNPFENLSEYGFFQGVLGDLIPTEGVLPYDLNSPLFSDYAHKSRFVWMPAGVSANFTTEHVFDFPKGTVLIKNFYYTNDERSSTSGRRIIETRLLIHREAEWEALSYVWNKEQTDAIYDKVGDIVQVSWIDSGGQKRDVNYIIPNKNQCKTCHGYKGALMPIGPKVANLNKDFRYTDGVANQLVKWSNNGYLSWLNIRYEDLPRAAVWDDSLHYSLDQRAMSYLDINCGHCHNAYGAANTSGLTLTIDAQKNDNIGIYKPTVSAGAGTGGHTYSIVPGHPETSVMVYRMASIEPGAMMPELGKTVVHQEGVKLISDWIREMKATEYDTKSLQ